MIRIHKEEVYELIDEKTWTGHHDILAALRTKKGARKPREALKEDGGWAFILESVFWSRDISSRSLSRRVSELEEEGLIEVETPEDIQEFMWKTKLSFRNYNIKKGPIYRRR